MKFTINRKLLLSKLGQLLNLVSPHSTLLVLNHVLVRTEASAVFLTGTDLDSSMRIALEADIEDLGAATVHARDLATIIALMECDAVSFACDDKARWTIDGGGAHFEIQGLAEDEFPPMRHLNDAPDLVLSQTDLKTSLSRVQSAVSRDETRYALNGVLFEIRDNKLTLVATDGRRLALTETEVETPRVVNAIVPSDTVRQLASTLDGADPVSVQFSATKCAFAFNGSLVVSKLIEANYPNYRQVIPQERKTTVTIRRVPFLAMVKRMACLVKGDASSNPFHLHIRASEIEIRATNPRIGVAHESMNAIRVGPDEIIALNPELMVPALEALDGQEHIHLGLCGDLEPIVIKANCPFLFVQMPMRLGR